MNFNVNDLVEEYRDEIIGFASDLIKIPSENIAPDGNEKEVQVFLDKWFKQNKIDSDMFELLDVPGLEKHEAYWPGRNYKDRPNVVGFVK